MVVRAVICTLILLTQPLAAWAGVMPMPVSDDVVTAGDHCAGMGSHAGPSSDQAEQGYPECETGCDDCVAAAGIAAWIVPDVVAPTGVARTPLVLAVMPAGIAESPYRPPGRA